MQITKNFNLDEFHCKDGTKVPEEFIANVVELAQNLQVLRDKIGQIIENPSYAVWQKYIEGNQKLESIQTNYSEAIEKNKEDARDEDNNDGEEIKADLKVLQEEVIERIKKLGGSKDETAMTIVRSYVSSGNPYKMKDATKLNELAKELDTLISNKEKEQ